MNTRICSVVATVTLLMMTTGCSGMRNFLFGRGARCGSSNPAPAAQQQPCGGNTYAPQMNCNPGVVSVPQGGCGTCGETYGSAYLGGCGCGTTYSNDPYMSGEVMGSMPYPGQVIDVTEGVVGGDNFGPRVAP